MSPAGLESEKGCADEDQEQLKVSVPTSRQRGCTIITRQRLSEDNFSGIERKVGRESQMVA
jgi:hypothetical protein